MMDPEIPAHRKELYPMETCPSSPLFPALRPCPQLDRCSQCLTRQFPPGATAYTYGEGSGRTVGVLRSGRAALVKIDAKGGRTLLERLGPGGVFGELIAFSSLPCDSVSLVCETACKVLFLPQQRLAAPCERDCGGHQDLALGLLSLLSRKAFQLSERVEVLSCRTIQEKLLCYFRILAYEQQSLSFPLPFSLSALADYLCCDRSAMMRELKKLKEEGVLSVQRRQVTCLSQKPFSQTDLCAAGLGER